MTPSNVSFNEKLIDARYETNIQLSLCGGRVICRRYPCSKCMEFHFRTHTGMIRTVQNEFHPIQQYIPKLLLLNGNLRM